MRIPENKRRRRAVSGIIATVFMFIMLFTVGTGYFIYVNNVNTIYTQNYITRSNHQIDQHLESLSLTSLLSSTSHIGVYGNNTGGEGINVTAIYVFDAGVKDACIGNDLPSGCTTSTSLPVFVNTGGSFNTFDTGYTPTGGQTYEIYVVSSRGNVWSITYPPIESLVTNALASGSIGDLYLNFQSYEYYTITHGGSCPSTGSDSGYCISYQGQAFAVPSGSTGPSFDLAFSVRVTDLNNLQKNIVLDPYTLISLVPESGKGSLSYTNWYIISNSSTAILSSYTAITLTYDKATTIVFASSTPLTSGTSFTGSTEQATGTIAAGTTTPVFVVSHGCENAGITTCSPESSSNYGQNSPYVTTLFY